MRKISSITEVDVEPNQFKTRKTPILQCFCDKINRCVTREVKLLAILLAFMRNYLIFRILRHAPVDQSAQIISSGWNSNLMARARSLSSPKALILLRYCEILPGKTAMKNSAVTMPTSLRYRSEASQIPSAISTTPEASTTKSADAGTQLGTWAWNSIRLVVRCKMPA